MRILAVAKYIPMRDRSAGSFRFAAILEMLAAGHEIFMHARDIASQERYFGQTVVDGYRRALIESGVTVTNGTGAEFIDLMRSGLFEATLLEHYQSAKQSVVELIRLHQPKTRIVVDTVDVAFSRLESKARLTGLDEDRRQAVKVRQEELDAYSRSDLVIAVSRTDAAIIERSSSNLHVDVVPLIFRVPALREDVAPPRRRHIMFVADFHHDANVDGIRYFCGEVLPLVARERPDVRLRIVGASPPGEVQALAGPNVEVLGFVQDLDAIYRSSDVSIAPMRFGGGLKGKIAEAMAFGVPVATNSISLTGFEARPGVDVMVGDDPQAYAQAVLALLRDDALYDSVRRNAWHFVHANYSREAVGRMLDDIMARIPSLPVKQLPLAKRAAHVAQSALERHVTWRFR